MTGSVVIRDALVLPAAGESAREADVLVEDGIITFVGASDATVACDHARVVDGRGKLLAPGLVNAHMHSQSATMSGFADRLSHPAFMWMTQAHTSRRTPDETRLCVLLCAIQMLKSGTTAAIDHFPGQRFSLDDMEAVLRAWEESGMRAVLAMRFFDRDFGDILPAGVDLPDELARQAKSVEILKPHPLAAYREEASHLVGRWHGRSGRLSVFPAPSNPDRCSDEALIFCAELAERGDLGIHTHLLETRTQARMAKARYGESTLAHLERIGVLSGRWSCAHSIWLDDSDIALMAARGAVAVHNPESNARIGAGRMRTPDMIATGVPIALGTDGSGANDNLVMHEAMRAAAFLHRADEPDRMRWVSASDAFSMATEGGARAMCLEGRIGRIAPGMKADLVLYDLDAPWWVPVNDPVAQLVFAETGAATDLVMVDGSILVERGRIVAFDADMVLREARAMAAHLARRNADLFAVAGAISQLLP